MTLGPLDHETTKAIHKQLRILGYSYPGVEWDGALAAARAYADRQARETVTTRTLLVELHARAIAWNDCVMVGEVEKWLRQIPDVVLDQRPDDPIHQTAEMGA